MNHLDALILAFLITRTIVFVAGYLGEIAIPGVDGAGLYHVAPNNVLLDVWARWNSAFYLGIVNEGYNFTPGEISSVAFFPLYPLLIKLVTLLTGNVLLSGVLVSNLSLLGGLIFLYKLAELEWLQTHGWTLMTIHRASAWRNLWAGLRTDWHNLAIILLAPLGLLTHMRFLGRAFGDPLAFWTIQSAWEREDLGFVRIVLRDLTPLFSQNFGTGDIWWHVILDLSAFFFAFIAAFFVWRRLGAGYAIYTLLGVVLPANSGTGSISRYILVLFPLFLMLGYWGRNRNLHNGLIIGFSVLLGVLTTIFVNWVFVA